VGRLVLHCSVSGSARRRVLGAAPATGPGPSATGEEPQMHTLSAPLTSRTGPAAEPCVAGDIGPERREIEFEPVADPAPAPAAPSPVPAPAPAPPAPVPAPA
jgi:hypothetical protein